MPNDTTNIKGIKPEVILIEPFYGGSHKVLIDNITANLSSYTIVTLPAKKWHWRSRCGALYVESLIPKVTTEKVLFCSSVLNLAELIGLRPDLANLKKIIYFHENQLIYPVQEIKNRDIQYPYNQIISCLAADIILFNSHFNQETFLSNIKKIIKIIPNYRSNHLEETLKEKSSVLYFPIAFPVSHPYEKSCNNILHIVWPHRWEFDKGPEDLFNVLYRLKSDGLRFKLTLLGECFQEVPEVISTAIEVLKDQIHHVGYIEQKTEYFSVLSNCDVAVSTSRHEFFGVAMLECVHCFCFPLVPNKLVYPEIYPYNCLYDNLEELYIRLKCYCKLPEMARSDRINLKLDTSQYSTTKLIPQYLKLLSC